MTICMMGRIDGSSYNRLMCSNWLTKHQEVPIDLIHSIALSIRIIHHHEYGNYLVRSAHSNTTPGHSSIYTLGIWQTDFRTMPCTSISVSSELMPFWPRVSWMNWICPQRCVYSGCLSSIILPCHSKVCKTISIIHLTWQPLPRQPPLNTLIDKGLNVKAKPLLDQRTMIHKAFVYRGRR